MHRASTDYGQDRTTDLIPAPGTCQPQYLYWGALTHECPAAFLHKHKSHTAHQWSNRSHGTCPWGQRWDNDKIRGLRKGKTRKEEFKQLWSGSLQNILLLLPTARVSCAWSWQTWSLAAPVCAKESSKSKHPFLPTQGQAASVAARDAHICGFRHFAAWRISSSTDLNSHFCSSFRTFTAGWLCFDDRNVINVKHCCEYLHANVHWINHLHCAIKTRRLEFSKESKVSIFCLKIMCYWKIPHQLLNWAQVEQLVDATHPFLRCETCNSIKLLHTAFLWLLKIFSLQFSPQKGITASLFPSSIHKAILLPSSQPPEQPQSTEFSRS